MPGGYKSIITLRAIYPYLGGGVAYIQVLAKVPFVRFGKLLGEFTKGQPKSNEVGISVGSYKLVLE